MALHFVISEITKTRLWDFGWFDLTRFRVEGPPGEWRHCKHILAEFIRHPISQRSFCTLGPWGESVRRHGPYLHEKLSAEWFRPITYEELEEQIKATFEDEEFTEPPSAEQRRPVEAWVEAVRKRGDDVFLLDPPDRADVRVEWDFVWSVYVEFVSVSPDREFFEVGVIGYD